MQSGSQDPQGRDERGAARLGHQRRRHVLLHRHRGGPASLSGDGARLPVDHRPRDARADAWPPRAACRIRWSPASAAAPTPWACSTRSSTTASVEIFGVEAAGHGLDDRPARRLDRRRPARRAARQPHLSADGRRRPDRRGAFDLGRPRLSRHRPRACLAARHGPRQISVGHRRRGARRRSSSAASSKASSRRSSPRTRWPG